MTRQVHGTLAAASLLFAIAGIGCGAGDRDATSATSAPASAATSNARPAAAANTGRIRGTVTLAGQPPAARAEATLQNQDVCGHTVPVTRLRLGPGGGVQQAFIYLENVPATSAPRPRVTLEVGQRGCVYTPHNLVFPTGASLEIVNDDPILHNVHAKEATADGPRTVFNIAQPVRGQRTKLDAPFAKTGVMTLTCEAGHPWMTAHVLVADHPYVAVTGEDGTFTIENVPAGTYPITMWHEGVALTRVLASLQRYEYEDPYQKTEQVVVPAGGEAVVTFGLQLR